jgi:guanine nucleotide-binding protein subunit alpha
MESLTLFEELTNCVYFRKTPIVLLLNKEDIFREKIIKINLNIIFPNYTGTQIDLSITHDIKEDSFLIEGGLDITNASNFIKARFLELNHSPHTVYLHFVCALETNTIKSVFKTIVDLVTKQVSSSPLML